jgi:hypothetical protein
LDQEFTVEAKCRRDGLDASSLPTEEKVSRLVPRLALSICPLSGIRVPGFPSAGGGVRGERSPRPCESGEPIHPGCLEAVGIRARRIWLDG